MPDRDGEHPRNREPAEPDPEPLTLEQIDAVLAFLPAIEAPDADFGEGVELIPTEEGEIAFGHARYSLLTGQLMEAIYENGFLFPFPWFAWEEGRRILGDPQLLAEADQLSCRKLLVAFMQNDRFCEGAFGAALEGRHIPEILRRLAQLRAEKGPADPSAGPLTLIGC